MGRRAAKQVYDADSNGLASTCRSKTVFVYQDWTLIAEYEADTSTSTPNLNLKRSFTWGPDLTGGADAGGIGGLLAIRDHSAMYQGTYNPSYDGNGNVTALTNADTGELSAAYEYDPYGNAVRINGTYAFENPIRFSSKYQDSETGLVYYGFRYYSPSMGRFLNRDPLLEDGGINIYAFTDNNPINNWDYLGLAGYVSDGNGGEIWQMDPFVVNGNSQTDNMDMSSYVTATWGNDGSYYFNSSRELEAGDSGWFSFIGGPSGGDSLRYLTVTGRDDLGRLLTENGDPFSASNASMQDMIAQNLAASVQQGLADAAAQMAQMGLPDAPAAPDHGVGAPGMAESMIPIWGSGRAAINDFQNGRWGWGIFNTAMAVSDVFMAKALVTAGAKGLFKLGVVGIGAMREAAAKETAVVTKDVVSQVLKNQKAGNAFRDELAALLRKEGRDVQTEVYKKTPFGKRFIDIEVSQNGTVLGGIEAKVGSSRYRTLQRLKDWWLKNNEGYIVNVARQPK